MAGEKIELMHECARWWCRVQYKSGNATDVELPDSVLRYPEEQIKDWIRKTKYPNCVSIDVVHAFTF